MQVYMLKDAKYYVSLQQSELKQQWDTITHLFVWQNQNIWQYWLLAIMQKNKNR